MCGIAGFIEFSPKHDSDVLESMTNSLQHRGPDASGIEIWNDEYARIAFGHRRLSIIDLSPGGAQPKSKNLLHITFNGEIYNFQEIRSELKGMGHSFESESDTEVILSSFEQWGIACIHKFIGMFAFVIYDSKNKKVTIVRDRAGIKPLYFSYEDQTLIFGSELKALVKHPAFNQQLCIDSTSLYFQKGYIPAPRTIYQQCYKLEAGHYLELDLKSRRLNNIKYWSPYDFLDMDPIDISEEEYIERTNSLLTSSFNYRLIADVPVGVFLSSGYDSTLVTALLQKDKTQKLNTFTVGFDSKEHDESIFAEKIAKHIGTNHTTIQCNVEDAKSIIPEICNLYDEPFGDSSCIPTYLVSKIASQNVKVALSADGGDEQFVGYNRYPKAIKIAKLIKTLPKPIANLMYRFFKREDLGPNENRIKEKISQILLSNNIADIPNIQNLSLFHSEAKDLLRGKGAKALSSSLYKSTNLNAIFATEYNGYMQDDILTKVDRASMACGLEARDPLLDHRIAEWTLRTPLHLKYKNNTLKYPLKKIVHTHVPKALMDRKKKGFSVPIFQWLRKDLSWMIDELINENKIKSEGLFDWSFISPRINRFKTEDDSSNNTFLWHLLVFQQWKNRWVNN